MLRSQVWLAGAALCLLAATPAAALTKVKFSFTAGDTPVQGVFTLDCPPGVGPCAILALDGTFGATPISKDPDTKPDPPVTPPVPPDNLLTRPEFQPTGSGADFWMPGYHGFFRKEDEDRFLLMLYDTAVLQERYSEFIVTDYEASVPEPTTWSLLILGFAGVGAGLRGRRARSSAAPI
jgi:hypothetical protein